jgi:hypothetical protein
VESCNIVIEISDLFSVELAVPYNKRSSRKLEQFCCDGDGENETNEAKESLCNGPPFILYSFAFYSNFIGRGLTSDSRGERAQIFALVDQIQKRPLYGKSSRISVPLYNLDCPIQRAYTPSQ